MSFIPEVIFEIAPLDLEAEMFYENLNSEGRYHDLLHKVYPELRLENPLADKDACLAELKTFILMVRQLNSHKIEKGFELIRGEWSKVNNEYLTELSRHFETEWPEGLIIRGYLSCLPNAPRFLDLNAFFIWFWNKDPKPTIAHEIQHFLWFKKWKEVFPESNPEEFEYPHLVWRLSEIMDPVIMKCNPVFDKLIRQKSWGYKSFEKLSIDGKSMSRYFADMYLDCLAKNDDFAIIMKKMWKEAQDHRKVLESFE